jgi:alpha-tubulin suppressor-like RCC1 family protein
MRAPAATRDGLARIHECPLCTQEEGMTARRRTRPVSLALAVLLAACGGDGPTQASVLASVQVTPPTGTLLVQDTVRLGAVGRDQAGQEMAGLSFAWSSSDPAVATVDNSGLVRGVSAGPVTITATVQGRPGSGAITVELGRMPALASGGSHACALGADGGIYCWGAGASGQLGGGSDIGSSIPVAVSGTQSWAALTAGQAHACAVASNGRAYCWGDNTHGQLGTGSNAASQVPALVASTAGFLRLEQGRGQHSCAVGAASDVRCWGWNEYGQVGTGHTAQVSVPMAVNGGQPLVAVSAGYMHSCGLTAGGAAYCWGDNRDGQLGTGTLEGSLVPVAIPGRTFRQLSAGDFHTCGVGTDDRVYCWGDNTDGQLGSGGASHRTTPTAIAGDLAYSQVSAGFLHTCARTSAGAIRCWGGNGDGQLGNGTLSGGFEPVPVAGASTYASVTAGDFHTCAVATDGKAHCWGWNAHGQLGDGTTTDRSTPVEVGGGVSFASTAALAAARSAWRASTLGGSSGALDSEARKRAIKGLDPR